MCGARTHQSIALLVMLALTLLAQPVPATAQDTEFAPDLAIVDASAWHFEEEGRVLVLEVEVANLGANPSPEVLIVASAWDEATAAIPPLASQESFVVELALPIPAEITGTAQEVYLEIDPEGTFTDANRENNVALTPPIDLPRREEGEPLPDLAILSADEWRFEEDGRVLVLLVDVANLGDAPAPRAAVVVFAWEEASAMSPPLDPQQQARVELPINLPSEAQGSVEQFYVEIDPNQVILDVNRDNNGVETPPIEFPLLDEPGEVAPRSNLGLLVLAAGGALAIALAAGGLVLAVRLATRPSRRALQKRATEHDPPDECTPGRRWVKKTEIEVKPGRWQVSALAVLFYDAASGATGRRYQADRELVKELNKAIQAKRRSRQEETLAQALLPGAARFAGQIMGWQALEPVAHEVSLDAQLEGGEAEFQFEAYRCKGAPGKTVWVKERSWKASVKAVRRHGGTIGGPRPGEPPEGYAERARREVADNLLRLVETVARM
jgi:hypothetical protein